MFSIGQVARWGGYRAERQLLLLACCVMAACRTSAQNVPIESSYFPLALGNTWTYRCSLEGEYQTTKKVALTTVTQNSGFKTYRMEVRVGKDPKPLVSYVYVSADGIVMEAFKETLEDARPLISVSPKVNQGFGDLKVVKIGRSDMEKYSKVKTVFLENYSAETPGISQEKYWAWRGKRYGQGIGLLVEADGAGGDCELSTYRLKPARR